MTEKRSQVEISSRRSSERTLAMLPQSQRVRNIKNVVDASSLLRDGIQETHGLTLVGNSWLNIVAFTIAEDPTLVNKLNSFLRDEGWYLRTLDNPPALQVCLTNPMAARVHELMMLIREKFILVNKYKKQEVHASFSAEREPEDKRPHVACLTSTGQKRFVHHDGEAAILQRYSQSALLTFFGNVCGR